MSDSTKTLVFDGAGSSNGTFDPNLLLGMMFGGGGFGGFGGGANWIWPLFLFALFGFGGFGGFGGWGGNGFGTNNGIGFLSNQINEDAGRQLVLQGLNCNKEAIAQLSSALNCTSGQIQSALNLIQSKLCDVGNQVGMTGMQVINAIDRGDSALASQLAACCCDLKGAIKDVAIGQERGFSSLAYANQQNKCDIEKAISGSTTAITARLDAMEKAQLYDKIDKLREDKSTLTTQLNIEHQTAAIAQTQAQMIAPINAALASLQSDVDGIKCKLPRTETVVAQPNYIPVNYGVNVGLAPYACGYGCGYGFGFGNGWNNGGSLWG